MKEKKDWMINSIELPVPDIMEGLAYFQLPSEHELVGLVSESMKVFAESVNARDMAVFYAHVSSFWQQEYTVENFEEFFSGLYDTDIDLPGLQKYRPYFSSEPYLGEDDSLVIAGYYLTGTGELLFEQRYIYEDSRWKLTGFSLDIDPSQL